MNLFDIMKAAGDGNPWPTFATQYGLSQEQIAKAVEAFMPAFGAALKHRTDDPLGLMEFIRQLALGNWGRFYSDPSAAFRSQQPGGDFLAFLFGSNSGAKAMADQAASFSGLSPDKMREMMPALAAMMLGGLAEQAARANPLIAAMLKEVRAGGGEKPSAKGPLDRYEEEEEKREREAAAELARAPEREMGAGIAAMEAGSAAWREAMSNMMATMGGGALAANAEQPETEASGRNIFGEMFEPGLCVSEAYRREIEALLAGVRPDTSRK